MAIHRLHNCAVVRRGVRPKQRDRSHDHSRRAIAALHRVQIQERLLHAIEFVATREAFDRLDAMIDERRSASGAGAHRLIVNEYGAGAALALTAAVLRPCELERFAKDPKQAGIGINIDGAS